MFSDALLPIANLLLPEVLVDYFDLTKHWNYYIALGSKLRDLELKELTLNYEKKKQNL